PRRKGEALLGQRGASVDPRTDRHRGKHKRDGNAATTSTARPERTRAGRRRHHPSSWYNSVTRPVTPPRSAGKAAAANGGIRPALLRSPVIFAKTKRKKPPVMPPKTIFCTPPKR